MYDIINGIIDHVFAGNSYSTEQSYIYYICGAVICLLISLIADLIYKLFHAIIKG